MKKLKISALIVVAVCVMFSIVSCTDAGTLQRIDRGNNDEIEVFRYFYDDGKYVYVARFKDTPKILTTTWEEQVGKTRLTRGNVVIFENDSIQVVLKNYR